MVIIMIKRCTGFPEPTVYHILQNPLCFTTSPSPSSPWLVLLLDHFFLGDLTLE